MSRFSKTLEIGGIGFLIESEQKFVLSKRCVAFEKVLAQADVTIRLRQGTVDTTGCSPVHSGNNFDVVRAADRLITVRYANERKDDLIWWVYSTGRNEYELCFAETLSWAFEDVNPLFFFNLEEMLMNYSAVILHSAVIADHGMAIAFTAPSQTGKSTQADLWHAHRGAEILNGDRGLIRRFSEEYRAYGSPYAGSSGIYVNKSAPLRAIVVLKQAPYNRVRRIGGKEAYLHLLSQISLSVWNKEVIARQSSWLLELIARVPVYLLECLPNEGAVETLEKQLKEDSNE